MINASYPGGFAGGSGDGSAGGAGTERYTIKLNWRLEPARTTTASTARIRTVPENDRRGDTARIWCDSDAVSGPVKLCREELRVRSEEREGALESTRNGCGRQ